MIIDFENSKLTITKAEIDELFALDTYEDFIKAVEDMARQVPDCFSAMPLYNYLKNIRGEQ